MPRAWEMRHGGGLDPEVRLPDAAHVRDRAFQGWTDDPSYPRAGLVVALGLAGIAAAWWLATARTDDGGFVAGAVTRSR